MAKLETFKKRRLAKKASHRRKFGCGLAQCGACTVHVDGKAVRSCVHPLSKVEPNQRVVTIEGLGQGRRMHPVQRAFTTLPLTSRCGDGRMYTPDKVKAAMKSGA